MVALTDTAKMVALSSGCGPGYAVACLDDVAVYNCCCFPNCTTDEFFTFMDGLEADIKHRSPGQRYRDRRLQRYAGHRN